ncbi:hypothetical protein T08_3532, partial [Trichinella sp. T8]
MTYVTYIFSLLIGLLKYVKIVKGGTKEFAYSQLIFYRAIVYKAPARNMGKALIARGAGWQDIQDVTRPAGHAVAKPLEHVIMAHNTNKFI